MQVVPLGTNGFFPSFGRQTMCFAVPYGKTLIILDAGTGLYRLAEPTGQELLRDVNEIHLYLSHYHLDHTFGFYAAFKLFTGKKVTVFAPSERKVFADLAKDYFPIDFENKHRNFTWKVLKEGNIKMNTYNVQIRKQYHNGTGSLAFRFSFNLAYVTDSEPTREGVEFVKGASLLLHEHYLSGKKPFETKSHISDNFHSNDTYYYSGKHVTTVGAATIAKEAGVGKLALIHHYPFADDKLLEKQLKMAKTIFPNTLLAKDLEIIKFSND